MISELRYFFSFQIKKQIHLIFFIECAQSPRPARVPPHPQGGPRLFCTHGWAALPGSAATATALREEPDPVWQRLLLGTP